MGSADKGSFSSVMDISLFTVTSLSGWSLAWSWCFRKMFSMKTGNRTWCDLCLYLSCFWKCSRFWKKRFVQRDYSKDGWPWSRRNFAWHLLLLEIGFSYCGHVWLDWVLELALICLDTVNTGNVYSLDVGQWVFCRILTGQHEFFYRIVFLSLVSSIFHCMEDAVSVVLALWLFFELAQ